MANNPEQGADHRLFQGQVFVIAMLLAFTIVICWRLLAGSVAPAQGFLWLGVYCICPIGWYCFGYLRITDKLQSNALLVNAIGWVFVATAFLVHYKMVLESDPGTSLMAVSTSSMTVLLLLGFLIIVIGGLFSWQAVNQSQSQNSELIS